jgi:long-chain fatty acid transport protein
MLPKALAILGVGLVLPSSGFALGIRLFDHDAFATARGDAFVATANNPSAVYYNPAGITQLPGHNVRGAVNVISVDAGFESRSSRDVDTDDEYIPLPGFFYTYTPEKLPLSFGVGYYMPFGLSLEWPKDGPFRTTTIHGELQDHTLSGVMAWKITDKLSIAAGPAVSYVTTDLRRGLDPSSASDEFKFKGDDFAFGVTAGLLWQPTVRHSFGISYRSPVRLHLAGEGEFTGIPIPKQRASVTLPLPQVIVGGYSFRPTPKWNLEVNLDWTDWECVNTPILKQDPAVPLPLQWENSFGVEFGVTRYFDNGMHVSGGYVFLEDSVPEKSFNPLVPDQDMHVFSAGVGGKVDRWTWDFTYQFTHGAGRDVDSSVYGPSVSGHYTFIAHAFSLSLGYKF